MVLEKSCGFGGSEVVLEEKFEKFQKLAANSLFKVDKDFLEMLLFNMIHYLLQ